MDAAPDDPPESDRLPESEPLPDAAAMAADVVPKVSGLLHQGDYIGAVTYVRDQTGLHLRECRAIVEQIAAAQGQKVPRVGCTGLIGAVVVMVSAVGWLMG